MATATTPFFAVVSIISVEDCICYLYAIYLTIGCDLTVHDVKYMGPVGYVPMNRSGFNHVLVTGSKNAYPFSSSDLCHFGYKPYVGSIVAQDFPYNRFGHVWNLKIGSVAITNSLKYQFGTYGVSVVCLWKMEIRFLCSKLYCRFQCLSKLFDSHLCRIFYCLRFWRCVEIGTYFLYTLHWWLCLYILCKLLYKSLYKLCLYILQEKQNLINNN